MRPRAHVYEYEQVYGQLQARGIPLAADQRDPYVRQLQTAAGGAATPTVAAPAPTPPGAAAVDTAAAVAP